MEKRTRSIPVDSYGKYRCYVEYICAFLMKLNVIKLLLNLLLLDDKHPDIEAVWDVVENIRPDSPDKFQVRCPSVVIVRRVNMGQWRCCDRT